MIKHLGNEDIPALMQALRQSPLLTVRIASLLTAYGPSRPFFDVWAQEGLSTILVRLDNVFFICLQKDASLEESAFEELSCFIAFNPHFQILAGEETAVKRVGEFIKAPYKLQTRNFMQLTTEHLPLLMSKAVTEGETVIENRPDLKKLFDVVTACHGASLSFAPWYVDMSHRIRHGCARAYLLTSGKPACACLVSAESEHAGLISSVTTMPVFRHRGFARAVIARACSDLLRLGKTPVLECTDELRGYYESLGFERYAGTAELEYK